MLRLCLYTLRPELARHIPLVYTGADETPVQETSERIQRKDKEMRAVPSTEIRTARGEISYMYMALKFTKTYSRYSPLRCNYRRNCNQTTRRIECRRRTNDHRRC